MIYPGDSKIFLEKPALKLSVIIVALNFMIYAYTALNFKDWPNSEFMKWSQSESNRASVVRMYQQVNSEAVSGRSEMEQFSSAMRDQKFWHRASTYNFYGDQVQITENKKIISEFYKDYLQSAQYIYGLGSISVDAAPSPWNWLTYQFVHASFVHLLANMLVLFLLLSYLENYFSSTTLATVYLLAGFGGGLCFLFLDQAGGLAVVGASAAISGLMGFTVLTMSSKNIPWFFIVAPAQGSFGKIYLPAFLIFPMFLVPDFIDILRQSNGILLNVAVSAHIGGALVGMALGLSYLLYRIFFGGKATSHGVLSDDDGLGELS